jgi:hypothetical protein
LEYDLLEILVGNTNIRRNQEEQENGFEVEFDAAARTRGRKIPSS